MALYRWVCPVAGTEHFRDTRSLRGGSDRTKVRSTVLAHLASAHPELDLCARSQLADQVVREIPRTNARS